MNLFKFTNKKNPKKENFKLIIRLFLLALFFIGNQINAQCNANTNGGTSYPGQNCTDYTNFGWNSTNDAASIEYDNFVSSFHSSVIRNSDGTFSVWGNYASSTGTDLGSPTVVNTTNFPTLPASDIPLKITKAGNDQAVMLTTNGLYAWGNTGEVLTGSIINVKPLTKLTIGGQTNGLPVGVTPSNVKMILAVSRSFVLLTCTGSVYVLSQDKNMTGSGLASTSSATWYQVKTNSTTFLSNIVTVRGGTGAFVALKSDGTLWTWGRQTYLGDGSAANTTRNFATQMTLPNPIGTIKMIGATTQGTYFVSYYVLYTDGKLYSLGDNSFKQLGDWTTTERTVWVQPHYTSAAGPVMNDIKWISPNESGTAGVDYGGINVINNAKNLYAWGNNNSYMLGLTTVNAANDPAIPNGLTAADKVIAVETGAHTSLVIKECTSKFGYVGHYTHGSIGNGDIITDTTLPSYTFATADVSVIGTTADFKVTNTPNFDASCNVCTTSALNFVSTPAGGTFSIVSGTGTITGSTLTTTTAGTVVVRYTVPAGVCGALQTKDKSFVFTICNIPPTANNLTNAPISVLAGATPISPLSATDSDGSIASYTITSLPSNGTLYLSGVAVTIGQSLTPAQAALLSFDPNGTGEGTNATFTFTATDNSGAVSSSATFTIPLAAPDNDGDGIADSADLDDDNDGILDTAESCNSLISNSWTAAGTGIYEYTDASSDTKVRVTLGNYTTFWDGTAPSTAAMDATCVGSFSTNSGTPITGTSNSLQLTTANGAGAATSGTLTVQYFNAAGTVAKTVINPRLHIGRLGGTYLTGGIYKVNSSSWALQGGNTLTTLSNNATFGSTSTSFVHNNIGGTATSFGECSAGMAAGTVQINGNLSSYTFNVTNLDGAGVPTSSAPYFDGIRIILENSLACNDVDGDGIPNSLDTDSDGDGCPDAVEGAGAITTSQISAGQITGGVDANGVPTAVSGGQAIGQSQDATKNDCLDADADGVPDWQDLDDDNDGILDTLECTTTTGSVYANENMTVAPSTDMRLDGAAGCTSGSVDAADGNPNRAGTYKLSNGNMVNYSWGTPTGSISGLVPAYATANAPSGAYMIINAFASTGQWCESISANLNGNSTNAELVSKTITSVVPGQYKLGAFLAELTNTNPETSSYQFVIKNASTGTVIASKVLYNITQNNKGWQYNETDLFTLTSPTDLIISVVQTVNRDVGADIAMDNFTLYKFDCATDTDGDGIINSLDLDSDNDGCLDAIEGDENVSASQLVNAGGTVVVGTGSTAQNKNLCAGSTCVDAQGVPIVVNSGGTADIGGDQGQGVGISTNAGINYECIDFDGDGISDIIDLDDDNDGILDCVEKGLDKPINQIFNLNGNATQISTTEVQLTAAAIGQSGQMWSYGKIDFTKSFDFSFETYLGNSDGGADGMAIVFHNDPAGINATGAIGGGIGARGIQNGIVLELDTYVNSGAPAFDPVSGLDHGQIWKSSDQAAITTPITLPNLEDGAWHAVVVRWNTATQTLSYTVDGTSAGSYTGDVVNNFFGGANKVEFGYTSSTGALVNDQRVRYISLCNTPLEIDTDGDGTPDYLDTDSDGDGCPDAIEGGDNITPAMLDGNNRINVAADGTTTPVVVDAQGVPVVTNTGSTYNVDGQAQGQTIGSSANAAVNTCPAPTFCYKPAQTSGATLDTNHGITALGRAGNDNSNWPMVRKGAWTVLEAKTKGFVVNRLTDAQIALIPAADLREGMMVYNITQDCLQINIDGTATGWKCFNTQTCPD